MIPDFLNADNRLPKHGWYPGHYCCKCRNCGKEFTGAKGSWTCSDCAYDFDELLQYEQLWRDFGFPCTAQYLIKKLFTNK